MAVCSWCKHEVDKTTKYDTLGGEVELCDDCLECAESDICIKCKEPLMGDMAINGLCGACQQIQETETERKRSEIMDGLGLDSIMELTQSVRFTEEDYEKWILFSQQGRNPEAEKRNRRNWIKGKLIREHKWSEEAVENNIKDIEYLMENYMHKIFKKDYIFMVNNGKLKGLHGVNIVEASGNVLVIEK